MRILVLGGGAQGSVIASDLARSLPESLVTVADCRDPRLPVLPNLDWVEADLAETEAVARFLGEHDLGVGALPSRLGFGAMQAAIAARRNLVDVSFAAEDPLALDAEARAAGVTIVPDCGLAPGLSHLLVGRAAAARGTPRAVMIYVGGVAEDPARPYGYVVTWSLDDLLEEYTRPARIMREGRVTSVPAFSGLERIEVNGVGEMEAFYSDGLRTLLATLPGVPTMEEKTLRWPGHVEAVRALLGEGSAAAVGGVRGNPVAGPAPVRTRPRGARLIEEFRARCVADPPRDLVVLLAWLRWEAHEERFTLVDRYDRFSGLTAMARTTAFTTSVVAQLTAHGGLGGPGVQPLECVGRDEESYRFIVGEMARRGVRVRGTS